MVCVATRVSRCAFLKTSGDEGMSIPHYRVNKHRKKIHKRRF